MFKKLLIISGPTATGKTALAVKLAKIYHGELISADSRQVYRGLDIGVGKDHPPGTPIHLIDLIDPQKKFSVAQFRYLALKKIEEIHSRGRLPIVVGGSGLYINSLISTFNTFHIKPRPFLRFWLNRLPAGILRYFLKILDSKTLNLLNPSDRANPYRLIRKIEIALNKGKISNPTSPQYDLLHLSLTAPNTFLYPRIDQRVRTRLKLGHLNELQSLLKKYSWSDPGLQVSAYACLRPYLNHQIDLNSAIATWQAAEHRDARRQKTYFAKIPRLHYIDISHSSWSKTVNSFVRKWYNNL